MSKNRVAHTGSALMLTILLILMLSLQVAVLSLVALRSVGEEGMLSTQSQTARFAAESALTNLSNTLYTYLGTHTSDQAATAYAQGAVSASTLTTTNPDTGATDTTSILTSGWIVEHRGDYYHLVGRGTSGGVDILVHRWVRIKPTAISTYDCTTVENQVLAGNIASVADADLIAYAQNNCMLKPAPASETNNTAATLYPVTAGTGSACSSGTVTNSGSGTLNVGSVTGSCNERVGGTYTQSKFATVSSSAALQLNTPQPTETDVDILQSTLDAYNYGSSAETSNPLNLRLNSMGSNGNIDGSNGDDLVVVTGNITGTGNGSGTMMSLNSGNDTVYIGGSYLPSSSTLYIELGTGTNTVYMKTGGSTAGGGQANFDGDTGVDKIYFNEYWDWNAYTYGGNDIISCTGLFGVSSCTGFGEGLYLFAGTGNDIISLDGPLVQTSIAGSSPTSVDGEDGNNIIYIKSISNTYATTGISVKGSSGTTPGPSLVIIGGNVSSAKASTIAGGNASSVLLKKTGITTTGVTYSGFARTLNY